MRNPELPFPIFDIEVSCGLFCYGGRPLLVESDMPQYADGTEVVKYEDAVRVVGALRALREAIEPIRKGERSGGAFGRLSIADDAAAAVLAPTED